MWYKQGCRVETGTSVLKMMTVSFAVGSRLTIRVREVSLVVASGTALP